MNEIPQEQLRMAAMDMAVRYLTANPEYEDSVLQLAQDMYKFFIGETK